MSSFRLKRSIKNLLRHIANRYEMELYSSWKIKELPLVNHLKEIFRDHRIDMVVDVGANLGQYHDLLREEVGYKGEILSFEPVKNVATTLFERSKEDPNWQIFGYALGSSSGSAEINIMASSDFNSFLNPRNDIDNTFHSKNSIVSKETVRVNTLDNFFQEAGIDCSKRNGFLKIDTQGFDMEVIKGGRNSLKNILALQMEASVRPIYDGMPNYVQTIEEMNQIGFDLSSIFPVTFDNKKRVIEFDCVFVNRDK